MSQLFGGQPFQTFATCPPSQPFINNRGRGGVMKCPSVLTSGRFSCRLPPQICACHANPGSESRSETRLCSQISLFSHDLILRALRHVSTIASLSSSDWGPVCHGSIFTSWQSLRKLCLRTSTVQVPCPYKTLSLLSLSPKYQSRRNQSQISFPAFI